MRIDPEWVRVRLSDGRELRLRIADHDFLRRASPEQRAGGVIDERGTVLFWPALWEGISVAGLLGVSESELEAFAGLR
jgi:hypothetical protein